MPTKKQLQAKIDMLNDALETSLSVSPERDNTFFTGGLSNLYEGRTAWDRKKIFAESLRAWRVNPIARRIVRLMTSFIIGKGIKVKVKTDPAKTGAAGEAEVQTFLNEWWSHPLNNLDKQVKRWKDEEVRTGNLFFLFNVQDDGMSIIRAVPAEQIEQIKTKENDIEQEVYYYKDENETEGYPAYEPGTDQKLFMLHYASNQPIGSCWGEADLSPLLVWIGRFSSWLESRVRLNHFRTAFMYVVRGQYNDEQTRAAREKTINANPPKPGSVLVTNSNNGEEWGILSASLDAFDASVDGTMIKKMIASGVGIPMHWLAEPEGSTRTTAEAAGTPTFRTLEEAQDDFFSMIISMARVALAVKGITTEQEIKVEGPDITERDNASLALAFARAYMPLSDMYDRELIDENELKGISFRMMAEPFEGEAPKAKRKPLTAPGTQPSGTESTTDPDDPKEETEE